tara:strand:- start:435 stop:665 length:231 start_codon:yes stop_codon:yes gene_type:complete
MINQGRIVRTRKMSLPQKIRLIRTQDLGTSITFVMPDGSKLTENLNESFLNNKKTGQIITDLYAICHDKGALKFII